MQEDTVSGYTKRHFAERTAFGSTQH